MQTLFAFFILAICGLFIVGLISPSKSLFWLKVDYRTRGLSAIIYIVAFVVSCIIFDTLWPTPPQQTKAVHTPVATNPPSDKKDTAVVVETGLKLNDSDSGLIFSYNNKPLSDSALSEIFQVSWKDKKLHNYNYRDYVDTLNYVLQTIKSLGESNPHYYKKVNKLYRNLSTSQKFKEANWKWLTYGQPDVTMEYEFKSLCENSLKKQLNDPESLDIDHFYIKGQSKNGWVTIMSYRAKNAFGAKILSAATFDIRFNDPDYYVEKIIPYNDNAYNY